MEAEQVKKLIELAQDKQKPEDGDRSMRMPKMKAIEPEVYSGLPTENAVEWLNRFSCFMKMNKVDPLDMFIPFRLLLRGVALLWYDSLEKRDLLPEDFGEVKPLFLQRFNDDSQRWMSQEALDRRRLEVGEDVSIYINDMLRLADRLDLTSEETATAIRRNLHPELKAYVISCAPPNLEALITKLQLGQTLQTMRTSHDLLMPPPMSRTAAVQIEASCDSYMTEFSKKLQQVTDQAAEKVASLTISATQSAVEPKLPSAYDERGRAVTREHSYSRPAPTYNYSKSPDRYAKSAYGQRSPSATRRPDFNRYPDQPRRAVFSPQGNGFDFSKIECWYCQNKGHKSVDCRIKARDLSMNRGGQGFSRNRGNGRGFPRVNGRGNLPRNAQPASLNRTG